MKNKLLENACVDLEKALCLLPNYGLGLHAKVEASLFITLVLENIAREMNEDPYQPLISVLQEQTTFAKRVQGGVAHMVASGTSVGGTDNQTSLTRKLFEEAWTVYNQDTYTHSVELIHQRLRASGYDEGFFKGKRCFDGGCGTGRFAIAMAQLGASEVVAVDIGGESLEFAKKRAVELGVGKRVQFVEHTVTDLAPWKEGSFDFVVSNGVLHHAEETERGLTEHFRITKSGGTYWIYLYGAGGFYWEIYDRLKAQFKGVDTARVREILLKYELRPGLVYSFLDNVCAPIRKYYLTSQVLELLQRSGKITHSNLKGTSVVDDTDIVLGSKYGREIYGPEGEVRIRVLKS